MQLNMVMPMDLGLERADGIDTSEMFDLGEVEGKRNRGLGRRGVKGEFGEREDEDDYESGADGSDELEDLVEEEEEEDDGLDDEERKVQRLENSLDALYDQYHAHKMERDAKHRAKEEKRKRDAAEGGEWHGIKAESEESDEDEDPAPAPDSDDQDTDDEEADLTNGMDIDNNNNEEEEDLDEMNDDSIISAPAPRLSKRANAAIAKKSVQFAPAPSSKLITKLVVPIAEEKQAGEKSRAAKMWFDQPMFKGLAGLEEMMSGDAPQEDDVDEEDGDETTFSDEESVPADESIAWEQMGSDDEAAEAAALQVWRLRSLSMSSFAEGQMVEQEYADAEESDDDFEGAVDSHIEDPNMTAEADFKGQEDAEEARRERIDSEIILSSIR